MDVRIFVLVVTAHILVVAMEILQMHTVNDIPDDENTHLLPHKKRRPWLLNLQGKL